MSFIVIRGISLSNILKPGLEMKWFILTEIVETGKCFVTKTYYFYQGNDLGPTLQPEWQE